jgi:hypothetical protein
MEGHFGSQAEYARHRGCSKPNVTQALRRGRIHLEPDGRLDFDKADAEWPVNTHPIHGGERSGAGRPGRPRKSSSPAQDPAVPPETPRKPSGPAAPAQLSPLTLARTRREDAAAATAELELQRRRGEQVDLVRVKRTAFEITHAIRDRLNAVPIRLRADLAATDSPVECESLVRREIDSALEDLQRLTTLGQRAVS